MKLNGAPLLQEKQYSEEELMAKKSKSFGVAKRALVMGELRHIALVNVFVSLGLFLLLCVGTSALPYLFDINIDFAPETFIFRGGLFTTICVVFLGVLAISGLWYPIAYKRLEVMCIHLYGGLDGALEVNEAARKDHAANNLEKAAGLNSSHFSSIGGPACVINHYLSHNGVKPINNNIFIGIKVSLIICQIVLALLCLGMLIK